jgi:flagellum-specific peptidoglycan hydrolase FlgJ
MKNSRCFPLLSSVSLMVLLFSAPVMFGQSTQEQTLLSFPASSDVQQVSARIAAMYGVDQALVEAFVGAAVRMERRNSIAAPVVIAIAIHESSFKSELFLNSGNPFGIQASKPWTGPVYNKLENGETIQYRQYNCPQEAVTDFGNLIESRAWYKDARTCPLDAYACIIEGLMKSDTEPGYSADPNWGAAVIDIIKKTGLDALVVR